MALVVKDRVKETTTTTGTGSISLGGAVTKFKTFSSALSNGDTTYYAIEQQGNTNEFEVGIGTYTSSGNILARTTILASSNSNNAVDFSAGTKNIFITYPADKAVYEDASGNISIPGTIDGRDLATDGTKLDGIEASATADQTASEILTAVKTVDGASSGLDADLLDGQEGSYYTNAANLTGTLPAISGANLTNVQAASVNVTESTDDNVYYNILFSDTNNAGTVQMTPTQDDGSLTFNPSTNYLYSQYAQHSQIGIDSYLFHNGDTNTYLKFEAYDIIKLGTNGTTRLHLNSSGADVTGNIGVSGTVDGRDLATDGSKLDGIAAGANVGIASLAADTSPQLGGNLDNNGKNINIGDTTAYGDNNTINVGTSADMKIFHDGSNSYIIDTNAGNLKIGSNGAGVDIVQDNPLLTGYIARFLENNGVELYYAKAKKFELSSTGAVVTGTLAATALTGDGSGLTNLPAQSDSTKMPLSGGTFTGDVTFADNKYAIFGASDDIKIGHNGNGLVNNYTNDLYIQNYANDKDVIITSDNGSGGTLVYFRADGSTGEAGLYHYGYQKIKTQSGGVDITGDITVSGTVDGKDVSTLTTAAAAADEATALAIALG